MGDIISQVNSTMNETMTVLIGTISGFIIAFLAEPVKTYFQNRAKLRNLRIALYKELLNNYYALTHFTVESLSDFFPPEYMARHELRTECYKQTLQNDISLFYQLVEANATNVLYSQIDKIMSLTSDLTTTFGKRGLKKVPPVYTQFSGTFKYMFVTGFYARTFDARILKSLVKPEQYQEIMRRGKEELEKDSSYNN